jgi:hypothetical protein
MKAEDKLIDAIDKYLDYVNEDNTFTEQQLKMIRNKIVLNLVKELMDICG